MRFRPCIDIHNGQVKQIVGGSLCDTNQEAITNFVSTMSAASYAQMYREDKVYGGHVIILNALQSPYFEESRTQALEALSAFPQGLQIGGGITVESAYDYLDAGASHVIVTSYLFDQNELNMDRLKQLLSHVGKERLVIDLSCRWRDDSYYVVTNRWQTFTNYPVNLETLGMLSEYCDEFLIHGIEVEGKAQGVEEQLVDMLSRFSETPITYAGGIGSLGDLQQFKVLSKGRLDYTIGSALDLFGGEIPYKSLV